MNFPNFNAWHKVPKDATIPEGTPVLMLSHYGDYAFTRSFKEKVHHYWLVAEYYTERPIADPDEAANWKKAEKMYRTAYSSLDDAWEYQSQDTKDRWYTLAKKYVEKED